MAQTQMHHPDLPNQPIRVEDSQIDVYRQSGWLLHGEEPGEKSSEGEPVREGQVVIYHPTLEQEAVVPEASVPIYRQGGWLLKSEFEANQREAAEREAASEDSAPEPAGRRGRAGAGSGRGADAADDTKEQ